MGKSLTIYAFLIHAYKHCKRRVAWGESRYVHTVTFLLVRIERHHSGHLAVNARIILKLTLHSRCDLISKKLYRKQRDFLSTAMNVVFQTTNTTTTTIAATVIAAAMVVVVVATWLKYAPLFH